MKRIFVMLLMAGPKEDMVKAAQKTKEIEKEGI
jgi:hypothetical protein